MAASEAIARAFNVLHDGVICDYRQTETVLTLSVEIEYLTERMDPPRNSIDVSLHGLERLTFETWPDDRDTTPETLRCAAEIFGPRLDILSAEIDDDCVVVACGQSAASVGYCGGFLRVAAREVRIADNVGQELSLDEVEATADEYWTNWAASSASGTGHPAPNK